MDKKLVNMVSGGYKVYVIAPSAGVSTICFSVVGMFCLCMIHSPIVPTSKNVSEVAQHPSVSLKSLIISDLNPQ